jgi:hypothetical protein
LSKNGKLLKTDRIDFKDIILITRFLSEFSSYPSLAIFKSDKTTPYVFLASSETKLRDWITQISIYCSKLCKFTSLLNASTCVSMDGFAYYSYFESSKPILFSQIGKKTNFLNLRSQKESFKLKVFFLTRWTLKNSRKAFFRYNIWPWE